MEVDEIIDVPAGDVEAGGAGDDAASAAGRTDGKLERKSAG